MSRRETSILAGGNLKFIDDLHVRLNSTVLIVTHDPEVAQYCSVTVAVLDRRTVEGRG